MIYPVVDGARRGADRRVSEAGQAVRLVIDHPSAGRSLRDAFASVSRRAALRAGGDGKQDCGEQREGQEATRDGRRLPEEQRSAEGAHGERERIQLGRGGEEGGRLPGRRERVVRKKGR